MSSKANFYVKCFWIDWSFHWLWI